MNGAVENSESSLAGSEAGEDQSVEDRINELARVLGIPSKKLASAIADAVRQNVPPASLSSVAAKETGKVVETLLKDGNEKVAEMPGSQNFVNSFVGFGEDELDS